MEFVNYIVGEGLTMIPVLYIIGEVIKGAELINNRWIPLLLTLISVGLTPLVIGNYSPDTIVQAILVAGATVYGNELVKQAVKDK